MHGKFIVLDGPDGSGTTRQSEYLAANLRSAGLPVLLTAEPTEGGIGVKIREALDNHEEISPLALQLLFCADRAQHLKETIIPALDEGTNVVCDRYSLSTLIYGAAQGIDSHWLEDINSGFLKPDLTIITLPPLAVCNERLGNRTHHDAFETSALQASVYEGYKSLTTPQTVFVDTSGTKEDTAQTVWQTVQKHFSNEVVTA